MKIAVVGASGYIGQYLIEALLSNESYDIVALSRHAEEIGIVNDRLHKRNVDVFTSRTLANDLIGCNVAFYLVHMMALKHVVFAIEESRAAHSFGQAAKKAGVQRVVFLGGLGSDNDALSKHLASRHHTGEILREHVPQVIEFRASMVIGRGSISYDIIAHLVHRLPVLTLPKWSTTLTQPIGLNDAIRYLCAAITMNSDHHEIIEIGGPEALSYGELMKRYAQWKGTRAYFIRLPIIPVPIAAWWLNLFTPKRHAKVGRAMVESLANPMVVTNDKAQKYFPDIHPQPLEAVFA